MQNNSKIYIGNLNWNTNDEGLAHVFSAFGNVIDSIVMKDRETGRSRGFGFVTYSTSEQAYAAIHAANDMDLEGRKIRVNLANAKADPSPGTGAFYGKGWQGHQVQQQPPRNSYSSYGGPSPGQQDPSRYYAPVTGYSNQPGGPSQMSWGEGGARQAPNHYDY